MSRSPSEMDASKDNAKSKDMTGLGQGERPLNYERSRSYRIAAIE
jgi:hypothetical protein